MRYTVMVDAARSIVCSSCLDPPHDHLEVTASGNKTRNIGLQLEGLRSTRTFEASPGLLHISDFFKIQDRSRSILKMLSE